MEDNKAVILYPGEWMEDNKAVILYPGEWMKYTNAFILYPSEWMEVDTKPCHQFLVRPRCHNQTYPAQSTSFNNKIMIN